ncbi:MAG: phosphoribosylformylglycinamidine cyclo-ligase [Spirochaetes bacterium]|nr:phosphoribosylformylglycinamidine cyclo-ligase [Spirochaetota bacterium]
MDYKSAGVDTHYAQKLIQNLKQRITATHKVPNVGEIAGQYGGFAGRFTSPQIPGFDVVATTDGVGTKTQLLRRFNYLDGIGQDLVAMCVNDLYCSGATPAFFLDYIACGKLDEKWYDRVLGSIADACAATPMALMGGETAEHPGVMPDDDFDLAGFAVGFVKQGNKLPNPDVQKEGDLLIALPSSGLHSNGFSLVRKIFAEIEKKDPAEFQTMIAHREEFIATWLNPTRIYTEIPKLLETAEIKGMAHITGGGIHENLPRAIAPGLGAQVESPEPFRLKAAPILEKYVERDKLFHTFNMGTGIILIADEKQLDAVRRHYPEAAVMGRLVTGSGVNLSV